MFFYFGRNREVVNFENVRLTTVQIFSRVDVRYLFRTSESGTLREANKIGAAECRSKTFDFGMSEYRRQ